MKLLEARLKRLEPTSTKDKFAHLTDEQLLERLCEVERFLEQHGITRKDWTQTEGAKHVIE